MLVAPRGRTIRSGAGHLAHDAHQAGAKSSTISPLPAGPGLRRWAKRPTPASIHIQPAKPQVTEPRIGTLSPLLTGRPFIEARGWVSRGPGGRPSPLLIGRPFIEACCTAVPRQPERSVAALRWGDPSSRPVRPAVPGEGDPASPPSWPVSVGVQYGIGQMCLRS